MFRNYFKITFRNFQKNRTFSLINTLGLALGFSCFTIILLFVENEFSFDRFHQRSQDIYRIVKDFVNDDGTTIPDATTPPALATVLREELPEVEQVTRFFPNWGRRNLLQYEDKRFYEMNLIRVDSNFFDVFDFPFVTGSQNHPFNGVHSILLTETTSKKYFGEQNPIGKFIRININNGTDYMVTGILKDVPQHSHFSFDVVIPFESNRNPYKDWDWYSFYTYVKLKTGSDPVLFESKIQELFKKYQPNSTNEFYIQPLTSIHLQSRLLKWELGENGDITYVRILLVIGLFVLVIAGINYVNLVTAQSARRAKEVGIRKVTGAMRSILVSQFLVESVMMVLVAFAFSTILTTLLLPVVKPLVGYDLSNILMESKRVKIIIAFSVLLIGILGGLYPAFYLSSFQPLKVLRGNFFHSLSGIRLRQGLVVFQFSISTLLIIGTLVISAQLDFMRKKKLGFESKNILMLPNVRGGVGNPEAMVEDLKKIASVKNVARGDGVIGHKNQTNGVSSKDRRNHIVLNFIRIDYKFLPALEIKLQEGRNFSDEFPSDAEGIIINSKAAKQLGLTTPYTGQQLTWDDEENQTHDVTIVGVVEDFHFTSFHEEIKPFGFILEVNNGSTFFLKIESQDLAQTIEEVENVWTKHNPDKPFEYTFQDEQMAKLHVTEARFQKLFSWFTLLAMLIACLGLFGLVTSLAESKTKEIGIRKVLGSTIRGIVALLSKEFLKLVLIAFLLASPLAYLMCRFWLEGFAYRVEIGWTVFILAGIATVVIAFITVCFQSIKAALANPVNSLRNE